MISLNKLIGLVLFVAGIVVMSRSLQRIYEPLDDIFYAILMFQFANIMLNDNKTEK